MREAFIEWKPQQKSLKLLLQIENVLQELDAQGYTLSLRQLHYQLVSRNITENTQKSYDNLGSLLTKARMSGFIDWDYIEDRHRETSKPAFWGSPRSILHSAANSYHLNRWMGQEYYIEVWVEKDALSGVVEPICAEHQVTFLACKGYLSASAKYAARNRFEEKLDELKTPVIIYLGDHDPSGLDMPRCIRDDLSLMIGRDIEVDHIGLTRDQIDQFKLPPNFAKETDSRMPAYLAEHGEYSWELDALPPSYLQEITETAIVGYKDEILYEEQVAIELKQRAELKALADTWKGTVQQ